MKTYIFACITFILIAFSCKKKESNYTLQVSKLKRSYIYCSRTLLSQAKASMFNFDKKIDAFFAQPLIQYFDQSKELWPIAYRDFLQMGIYRNADQNFFNPFAAKNSFFDLNRMNEGYIDYTSTNPNSGIIINETNYPIISTGTISSWNQIGGNENVSTGYHALEFLLWGEDLSTNGTGNRSHLDYVGSTSIPIRRRNYLNKTSQLLLTDLNEVDYTSAYEEKLLNADPNTAIEYMLSGLLNFIQIDFAENTILAPYTSQSQFDESSRFSDNSKNDLNSKLQAIETFLDAREYLSFHSDYFLIDFIQDIDSDISTKIKTQLKSIKSDIEAITIPFDQAIVTERPKVYQIYTDLMELHNLLTSFKNKIIQ